MQTPHHYSTRKKINAKKVWHLCLCHTLHLIRSRIWMSSADQSLPAWAHQLKSTKRQWIWQHLSVFGGLWLLIPLTQTVNATLRLDFHKHFFDVLRILGKVEISSSKSSHLVHSIMTRGPVRYLKSAPAPCFRYLTGPLLLHRRMKEVHKKKKKNYTWDGGTGGGKRRCGGRGAEGRRGGQRGRARIDHPPGVMDSAISGSGQRRRGESDFCFSKSWWMGVSEGGRRPEASAWWTAVSGGEKLKEKGEVRGVEAKRELSLWEKKKKTEGRLRGRGRNREMRGSNGGF